MLFLLSFVLIFNASQSKMLPSYIERCSKSDPNLNKCLDKSATESVFKLRDGNKDLGIVPIEPFLITKVDLGNVTSGSVSIHQMYENMKLFGMSNSTVKDSDANFTGDNCYWKYSCLTPAVRMESDYTMKGRLLLLTVNGHGKCTNYLYDIEGRYEATCERYIKKNRTYFRVTDFKFQMRPKKIVFDFENIIDGNEQLSREAVKTLNENSDSVYENVASAFNEVLGTIWKQTLNQVLKRVSEDELYLP